MNKRILAVIFSFVLILSVFGVGCDTNDNTAEQSSSQIVEEVYSSDESGYEDITSAASSEKISSDEYAFEEAPEGEEYDFSGNGIGAYFPSSSSGESSSSSSNEDDDFDIDNILDVEDILGTNNNSSNSVSSTASQSGSSSKNQSSVVSSQVQYSSQNQTQTKEESVYLDNDFTFTPLTADDDGLLDSNPDRGYRTELVLYIKERRGSDDDPRSAYITDSKSEIKKQVEKVFNIYFKEKYSTNKTFLAYIYITDFRDDDISKAAPVLETFFEVCRERKVKSMLRFCYNNSYDLNFNISQENKNKLASECADQATMLKHISQLAPYVKKYRDTIHTISAGFVGFVGEWAYSFQYPSVDYPTIMKAIVEELCVPNNLYFSSRSPSYKEMLEKDYKYRNYISHNNDAMYGEQLNRGWHSGEYQYGNANGWWDYVTKAAAYTPQDGEMYTNKSLIETYKMVPKGLDVILECAHHRHTSMSNWHGYLEALNQDNVMSRWMDNETVTTSWLKSKKILYDPNWFVDNNGNSVSRNPYEFLKDHLGYRISAVGGHVKGECSSGSTLNIKLDLKNYGFASAYMMSSGFAVLDANFNKVVSVEAGNPSEWYSHAPDNSATDVALTHTVSANLKLPLRSGTFYIAFYLKNTMNDGARLSNKLGFRNGYNVLFSIRL